MVRVIAVHHFANQHIQTVEQPTASTVAPPNRLLLALSSHCIEVRDVSDRGEVLFTFPTVDEVTQIVHCLNGDYVATVETKYNRQNRETNFVRVYVNWDNIATMQQSKMTHSGVSLGSSECGMVQPMRARIAGRVTPTTNQSELGSLEMIEIPVKRNPQQIQCCQVTGNIIIQMNKTITMYTFGVKTHDISKLKFIDFEEAPLSVDLSFYPRDIAICENYIACSSNDTLHMFRVLYKRNKEDQVNVEPNCEYNFNYSNDDKPIDYKQLLKNERLNIGKEKFTIHLPTIVKENSIIHKYCPFTFCDKDIKATIRNTILISESKNYEIENLIQLKLKPIMVELSQKQVAEEFKCMLLKPLYVNQNLTKTQKEADNPNIFRSRYDHLLHSIVCVITTQQEGYLYQFRDSDLDKSVDNCITVYPFTAPIFKIVMEDYFLHALTETGLETYTLRTCHELCRHLEVIDDENVACPAVQESVCLMGLRPFLGVEEILLCDNHLVLLANADSSPTHSVSSHGSSTAAYWTLYSLELPTPKTVFSDISIVANSHRFTSVQTYCHLMNEAHMILRASLILAKWNFSEGNVSLIMVKKMHDEDLKEAYRTCCALLGIILCPNEQEFILCVPYYKMALVYPSEVLVRIKKVQEQSNNFGTKGLLHYLKTILLDTKHGPEADKHYISVSKQNFSETIIELFEENCYEDLPNIVLKSNVLREYASDKLIAVLNRNTCNIPKNQNERLLALAVLYIQKCNTKKSQDILFDIRENGLKSILLENWELLFDQVPISSKHKLASFSELCVLIMSGYPDILSDILVALIIEKKIVTLHKMLKIFLEYLPGSIGSEGTTGSKVLQVTLEKYFLSYFTKYDNTELTKLTLDRATNEALKLLVRSYLSQLQILQLKEKNSRSCDEKNVFDQDIKENNTEKNQQPYFEEFNVKNSPKEVYLFSNFRHDYLDKMPPFQMEITSKLYEACLKKNCIREAVLENKEADVILKKLQAILCSPIISRQIVVEVVAFLDLNDNLRGCLSVQSIILNVNEAVNLLVDKCPQCLLQFGKDKFTKTNEWKCMIATIQSKIIRLSENVELKHVCFFYKKILRDVLTYTAISMNLEQLLDVFPQKMNVTSLSSDKKIDSNKTECLDDALQFTYTNSDDLDQFLRNSNIDTKDSTDILNEIQNYDPYILMCKETMHANQIKKLITATGQQLLCTLNL
ncbi:hermansky-pudlak syndrome 3 protein [Holotrichia oblita]|uniref:Hermansky-pudlak syndrome 3 protein n=1 Tax=Holotrichia oblita TaxID=644536 RepID=A0ACB9SRK7_HOLOL|nr:hermansky-pudlak syndrome 3 protein [Holotrichia oblita]